MAHEHPPKPTGTHPSSATEEVKNLVHEAAEAKQHGNKDEANFLIQAAEDLDAGATREALRGEKSGAAKP